ncbi:MAG TPA: hypothetical protein VK028_00330 [Micromonosporaceae bacterium]|nr:hypothetical protein [Micromonosporaceae bacterium]
METAGSRELATARPVPDCDGLLRAGGLLRLQAAESACDSSALGGGTDIGRPSLVGGSLLSGVPIHGGQDRG